MSTDQVLTLLTALLALGAAATAIFVTRYEHRDVLGRLSRLEAWQDRNDDGKRP